VLQPIELKLDPGSKVTGGAVVWDGEETIWRLRSGFRPGATARYATEQRINQPGTMYTVSCNAAGRTVTNT